MAICFQSTHWYRGGEGWGTYHCSSPGDTRTGTSNPSQSHAAKAAITNLFDHLKSVLQWQHSLRSGTLHAIDGYRHRAGRPDFLRYSICNGCRCTSDGSRDGTGETGRPTDSTVQGESQHQVMLVTNAPSNVNLFGLPALAPTTSFCLVQFVFETTEVRDNVVGAKSWDQMSGRAFPESRSLRKDSRRRTQLSTGEG